ncbi:MAG: hypothetical protein KDC69_09750 [Flavobacteriaceae bacterium]|nr:hypothetical protein [Flavobacteriaceae bacterium]
MDEKGYKFSSNVSTEHLRYLQNLYDHHEKRKAVIESKLAQITGQSGIVLSLMSLLVSLFYEKLIFLPLFFKIFLALIFFIGFTFLLISIFTARKTLNIKNYKYITGSTNTVLNHLDNKEAFLEEEIRDLIFAIPKNINITNEKGTELLNAQFYYNIGLISIGVLGLILVVQSITLKPQLEMMEINHKKDTIEKIEQRVEELGQRVDSLLIK